MRRIARGSLILAFWIALPAQAQEVGQFAVVQNRVSSLKPGATDAVPAAAGQSIVLNELEKSGAASAAQMTFGEGAVISIGQNTDFRVTTQAVEEATGSSTSTLDLVAGKMRVFVSRFWGGRPEVRVNTPAAVVGIKGSEVVVELIDHGATRVTVISGSAAVATREAPDTAIRLGPAQQLEIEPGGGKKGPDTADAAELVRVRRSTEADPPAPRDLPDGMPTFEASGEWGGSVALATTAVSSAGTTMGDPATNTVPDQVRSGQDGASRQIP